MRKQEKQRGQPGGDAHWGPVALPPECHTCTACATDAAPFVPPWPGRQDRRKPAACRCETAGTGEPNAVWRICPVCKKQAGQSSVEFALVVSIAIIMFLGMMQFGMYLFGLSIVENAARNGARQGSVSQSCPACEASTAAQSAIQGQPVIRDASVAVLAPGGVVGSTLRIRVTVHIPMILPGGNTFGLGPLTTVSAEATFRQEGWRP